MNLNLISPEAFARMALHEVLRDVTAVPSGTNPAHWTLSVLAGTLRSTLQMHDAAKPRVFRTPDAVLRYAAKLKIENVSFALRQWTGGLDADRRS